MKKIQKFGTEQGSGSTNIKAVNTMGLFISVLLLFLFSPAVNAQKDNPQGGIIFKGKIFTQGTNPNDIDYAQNAIISIVMVGKGVERKTYDFSERYGIFKEKLKLNEDYIVFISKKGYETKYFEFSTEGANPNSKYSFYADIILKKEGEAIDYSEEHPAIHVAYDDSYDAFVIY